MPVGMQLPQEAARIWTDPARRERIVAMHAEAMPLTEMCDELGSVRCSTATGFGRSSRT